MIRFHLYGRDMMISVAALLDLNSREMDLAARAENNPNEGYCTEVARWSYLNDRWERYAWYKFLGGEDGTDADAETLAVRYAKIINAAGLHGEYSRVINAMPDWAPDEIDARSSACL
jgi:hypothetical protein